MKKKLSLILALSMMLTVAPMAAFADSDNEVTKTPQVSDDYDSWTVTNAPKLRIEESKEKIWGDDDQVFRLELENAEWKDDIKTVVQGVYESDRTYIADIKYQKISTKKVEGTLTFRPGVTNASRANEKINFYVPLVTEVKEKGAIKVKLDGRDSGITSGTYTFANASTGDTVASVDKVETFADSVKLKAITIDETKIGSLTGAKELRFKLPANFEFKRSAVDMVKDMVFSGGFSGIDVDANTNGITPANGTPDGIPDCITGIGFVDDDEQEELKMTIDFGAGTTDKRGTITFPEDALEIKASSDAKHGDVNLKIRGDFTHETLKVADYTGYEVSVKADGDANEIFAGRYDDRDTAVANYDVTDEAYELQTLVIEENVASSWLTERRTKIEFPKWVNIRSVEVDADECDNLDGELAGTDDVAAADKLGIKVVGSSQDKNYVELTNIDKDDRNETTKLTLNFYVSVEADHHGDIEATVSGTGMSKEQTVVLGKAIAPVETKVDVKDVKTGIKEQEMGKITIVEPKDEAFKKGKVQVWFEEGIRWDDEPTVKVTKGDLEIDEDSIDVEHGVLTFDIDHQSTEPSTIEVTSGTVKLDRAVEEGDFFVKVGGDSLVLNDTARVWDEDTNSWTGASNANKTDKFDTHYVTKTTAVRVITPADANTQAGQEVKFVIGNAEYMVGDEVKTADVAPYIKDGRTMLSLRYVAEAMGVAKENILWDNATRSVTIFKGDRIAKVTIDSNIMMVNGTPVTMDTVAEIKDGRTMLPVAFVGKALGAQVGWDGATRTVTVK